MAFFSFFSHHGRDTFSSSKSLRRFGLVNSKMSFFNLSISTSNRRHCINGTVCIDFDFHKRIFLHDFTFLHIFEPDIIDNKTQIARSYLHISPNNRAPIASEPISWILTKMSNFRMEINVAQKPNPQFQPFRKNPQSTTVFADFSKNIVFSIFFKAFKIVRIYAAEGI